MEVDNTTRELLVELRMLGRDARDSSGKAPGQFAMKLLSLLIKPHRLLLQSRYISCWASTMPAHHVAIWSVATAQIRHRKICAHRYLWPQIVGSSPSSRPRHSDRTQRSSRFQAIRSVENPMRFPARHPCSSHTRATHIPNSPDAILG